MGGESASERSRAQLRHMGSRGNLAATELLQQLQQLQQTDPSLKAMMVKHLSNQILLPSPWNTCKMTTEFPL